LPKGARVKYSTTPPSRRSQRLSGWADGGADWSNATQWLKPAIFGDFTCLMSKEIKPLGDVS